MYCNATLTGSVYVLQILGGGGGLTKLVKEMVLRTFFYVV